MKVVVFGGTGPTGQLVVRHAVEAGLRVRVLARSPEKLADAAPEVEIVKGDALRPGDVARAIEGQDAVVSSLGVPYTFQQVTIFSEGIRHILDGMKQEGVKRLIAVSSGGTHPGFDRKNPWFFELLLKRTIGRTLYADMRRMEAHIMNSDVDWTILRPPRLLDKAATGNVRVVPGAYSVVGGSTVSRSDLAATIVEELRHPALVQQAAVVAD